MPPGSSYFSWLHHLHFCEKIWNPHSSTSTFSSELLPVLTGFMADAPGDGETLRICGVAGGLLMLSTCRCNLVRAGGLVHPGTAGRALVLWWVCWGAAVIWPEPSFGWRRFLHQSSAHSSSLWGVLSPWTTLGRRARGETRFPFADKARFGLLWSFCNAFSSFGQDWLFSISNDSSIYGYLSTTLFWNKKETTDC